MQSRVTTSEGHAAPGGVCQTCGGPLPAKTSRTGRPPVHCSAACRQKAYRARTEAAGSHAVQDLIADIERRVQSLAPQAPDTFYSNVTDLSSTVGRLRRLARIARDAAQEGPWVEPADNVTTGRATKPPAAGDEYVTPAADPIAAAVHSGDEWTFAGLVEPFRRELQVHCYRLVGSYDDSEDMVQETFLRAWHRRDSFEGRSTFRAWLYRIATNICLDFLRRNTRRPQRYEPVPGIDSGGDAPPARVTWPQPYPDQLLPDAEQPEEAAVSRETIELVFLTAIQHLPPRQRAVLVLRDVIGWPAADAAAHLGMSVASVNSALQRARQTVRKHLPSRRAEWSAEWSSQTGPTSQEREILQRYMDAADRADAAAVAELLSEDVVLTMPPNPFWFVGRDAMMDFITPSVDPASPQYLGSWKHLPTRANGQPAAAGYLCRQGTTAYRAQVLDVLRVENGRIAEITSFEPHLFPAFGLPLTNELDKADTAANVVPDR